MGWADRYIKILLDENQVKFRPRGNSMTPRIKSGQLCTVNINLFNDIAIGDVVLCKVNGSQYLHLVKAIRGDQVQIGNNHGKINGWTNIRNIYGKLIKIED